MYNLLAWMSPAFVIDTIINQMFVNSACTGAFGGLRGLGLPDTIIELKWIRTLLKRLEAQIQTNVAY